MSPLPKILLFGLVSIGVIGHVQGTISRTFSVGIISGAEEDSRQNSRKFWSMNSTSTVVLEPVVEDISWWSPSQITRAACSLLRNGVHFLVSAVPPRSYPILHSYSRRFRLPFLTAYIPVEKLGSPGYQVSLSPGSAAAVGDLMKHYQWRSFVYFYDNDDGPSVLQRILQATDHRISVEAFWRVSSGEEAQRFIQLLRHDATSPQGIVLATRSELVSGIISTLAYGTGVRRRLHFILVEPEGIASNSGRYAAHGSFVITKLSMGNSDSQGYLDLENRWHTIQPHLSRRGVREKIVPVSALVMRDTADVLQDATVHLIREMPTFNVTPSGLDCLQDEAIFPSNYAVAVSSRVKKVILPSGMTGKVQFSENGERINYSFNITEISPTITKTIGTWSSNSGLRVLKDQADQNQNDDSNPGRGRREKLEKQKFRVTSVLVTPYLSLSKEGGQGNDRFEGFIKDLLEALCESLSCEYELHLVKDGKYGVKTNEEWSGMIGEVLREEADMAVAPLTITKLRQEVIDFSRPFMIFGLNILMAKPADTMSSFEIGVLGFVKVWSYEIWLILVLTFFVLGGATYAISHFTGEPDRIRSLDTKLSDRLSLCSSLWFVWGAMTFRGTGIYPRSTSHRMLSVVCWIFGLVLLAFYISSLSSFLIRARTTSQTTHSFRRSADVLQAAISKGYPAVGTIRSGSTEQFFKNSKVGIYEEFGKYLETHRENLVSSYSEGVDRARSSRGAYAIVMESTSSEYFSNVEPCDTIVTAGLLDQKAYGAAFKKGSPLRESFNSVVIKLTEDGVLRALYEKWWYHKKDCEDPYLNIMPSIYSNSLTLKEASGIFYVLIIGSVLAALAAASEYFFQTKKLPVEN